MKRYIASIKTIVGLFFLSTIISCSSQSEALEECNKVSNLLNSKLINKVNKNIENTYGSKNVLLTRTYCDFNSKGDARINFSYDVKKHTSFNGKLVIDEFCSRQKSQVLFDMVAEVKYHYLTRNGKKLEEVEIFAHTCK